MPTYRPQYTQPPWQPQPLRRLFTPGPVTQGAQASPSITLSLAPKTAFVQALATASPSITLSLAPAAIKIALATASPSITLALGPILGAQPAQSTPSITLSLAPVALKIAVATATPSITLSLAPAGVRVTLATGTPSILLSLAASTASVATASPSITLAMAAGIVTDSFDRADNASSLGTADSGQVWSALSGTWGISSNKAIKVSSAGFAVVESGIADAIIQAQISPTDAAQAAFSGVLFRVQNTSNLWGFYLRPNLGAAILFKIVGGATTNTDLVGYTPSASSVLKVICIGTTIDCYVDQVRVIHATGRTDFQTATQHGLFVNNASNTTWDNFAVLRPGVASATVVGSRTATPSILLALTASAHGISVATVYTVSTTANTQGLVEPVFGYRGSP